MRETFGQTAKKSFQIAGIVELAFSGCHNLYGQNLKRQWGDDPVGDVTKILQQLSSGDPMAREQLLPMVYDELRQLAAVKLARERPGHTLEATALVHEAYLRFIAPTNIQAWANRGHFFGAAAEAMRRILIEQARSKLAARRGGRRIREELQEAHLVFNWHDEDLLQLDEALAKLVAVNPSAADVVKLRFFAGLTHQQLADALGISEHTARRRWIYARAWLRRELGEGAPVLESP